MPAYGTVLRVLEKKIKRRVQCSASATYVCDGTLLFFFIVHAMQLY